MRVWVVTSFVWLVGLETFDEVYSSLRETIENFQSTRKSRRSLTGRKGKSDFLQSRLRTPRKATQSPNQIIQSSTKIMDTIPDSKAQSRWRLFPSLQLDPQELIDSIAVFLGHHFIGYAFTEPSGLTLEVLHVLSCPIQTPMKLFKVADHE